MYGSTKASRSGISTHRDAQSITSRAQASTASRRKAKPRVTPRTLSVTLPAEISSDSVYVTSRFESKSRCVALGSRGTAWTGEADGSIVIRAAPLGYEVSRIKPSGRSTVTALLNTGGRMWAGYNDGAIRVYDLDTAQLLMHNSNHTAAVLTMTEVDGMVYTGSSDWKIYQWDASDFHFERMFSGHRNAVRCLCGYYDPNTDEGRLISGSDDGVLKIWNPSPAARTDCIATLDCRKPVLCCLVVQSASELWAGCEDGTVSVWDLNSKDCTAVVDSHTTPVVSMQQVEDSIWTGNKSGSIVIVSRFTKDIIHEAVQPPGTSSPGVGRFSMVLQPVQRTVVHNVWATNPSGSWQCWSCVCNESSDNANMTYTVTGAGASNSQSMMTMGSAGAPFMYNGSESENRDGGELNFRRTISQKDQRDRDDELRRSVARTRRTVNDILAGDKESSYRPEDSYPAISVPRENRSSAESDTSIDMVERSLRRDREQEISKSAELRRRREELAKKRQAAGR